MGLIYLFFPPLLGPCGILTPEQVLNLCPLWWKHGVLTTGPPGSLYFLVSILPWIWDLKFMFCGSHGPLFLIAAQCSTAGTFLILAIHFTGMDSTWFQLCYHKQCCSVHIILEPEWGILWDFYPEMGPPDHRGKHTSVAKTLNRMLC